MGILRVRNICAALACLVCGRGWRRPANYDVKTMNFDLWCQEQAHLAPDRCDKRLPEDEKTFEAYRAKIERYEIPYLKKKQNEIAIDRNILNNDPVDNPLTRIRTAQAQDRNAPALTVAAAKAADVTNLLRHHVSEPETRLVRRCWRRASGKKSNIFCSRSPVPKAERSG